jgi:hypothetical protein
VLIVINRKAFPVDISDFNLGSPVIITTDVFCNKNSKIMLWLLTRFIA